MDEFDRASEQEELFRSVSLHRQRLRPTEKPDEDELGRYCLSCGDTIPEKRVLAVPYVVRCIRCQTKKERK